MKYQNINKLTLPLAILLILLGLSALFSTYIKNSYHSSTADNPQTSVDNTADKLLASVDNTADNLLTSVTDADSNLSFDENSDKDLSFDENPDNNLSFDENSPGDTAGGNTYCTSSDHIYAILSPENGILYRPGSKDPAFAVPNVHSADCPQVKDRSIYVEFLDPDDMNSLCSKALPANYYEIKGNRPKLVYLHLLHYNFQGEIVEGELVANELIYMDLLEIFTTLLENKYPIEKMKLIQDYDCDDTASMLDNNTSCFNYRNVENSKNLSKHAYGCAIDLNPFYNPYVTYYGTDKETISPKGSEIYADRSKDFDYKIDKDDLACKLFKEHGFTWGGDWVHTKDYQHFQKFPSELE